ncbi:hypothetical protein B0T26DRAFT_446881 [Lasiosphaeria miniovina]|uniref:Uncharacterized protein n=1 Tax=Lasiosphaeria miniovina TaxID=1954250 RepID=A0AA39ZZ26_9PEZI|nr:uncharacterized protein B0T26DRAFT_446881 [Lasiosphaeria miniovina]KAK0706292.1 hypothetical protein B0T26DRAFT_446881 [Lasiosphaeria miniovina]
MALPLSVRIETIEVRMRLAAKPAQTKLFVVLGRQQLVLEREDICVHVILKEVLTPQATRFEEEFGAGEGDGILGGVIAVLALRFLPVRYLSLARSIEGDCLALVFLGSQVGVLGFDAVTLNVESGRPAVIVFPLEKIIDIRAPLIVVSRGGNDKGPARWGVCRWPLTGTDKDRRGRNRRVLPVSSPHVLGEPVQVQLLEALLNLVYCLGWSRLGSIPSHQASEFRHTCAYHGPVISHDS